MRGRNMGPSFLSQATSYKCAKGPRIERKKKKVLNYHIFHCQVIRDYKRFKAGMGQAALCLFMAFFILFSPIFAGNCSTQESSNPSLINISYNLLVILLIVHKQAI